MKVVSLVGALVLGVVISVSVGPAFAQAPVATAQPVPQDELIVAWLDTAKIAAQLANAQCAQLDSVKQWQRVQTETVKKIEGRLPGYTVNWQTFAVERKAALPAAK